MLARYHRPTHGTGDCRRSGPWSTTWTNYPEQTGTTSLIADVVGSGIGIYGLTELVKVVERRGKDLHLWTSARHAAGPFAVAPAFGAEQ